MESFYRVQDDAGTGPYQNSDNSDMLWAHTDDYNSHPSPVVSGGYHMKDEEICGFRTMQDLYRWFGEWLPGLLSNGYRVVKVYGTLRYEDRFQVVFKPS